MPLLHQLLPHIKQKLEVKARMSGRVGAYRKQSGDFSAGMRYFRRSELHRCLPIKHPTLLRTDFDLSLAQPAPPEGSGPEITALWWLCNRNWQLAHDVIDAADGQDAAWIHALLHLMEGDRANAGYWYARAGRSQQGATIGQEVELLLVYFLQEG